ncbi:hypothetical protein ALC57_11900, partial [Trachymyrmex cornetzi]
HVEMLNIYHIIRLTDLQNVRESQKLESLHETLKFISVIMDLLDEPWNSRSASRSSLIGDFLQFSVWIGPSVETSAWLNAALCDAQRCTYLLV